MVCIFLLSTLTHCCARFLLSWWRLSKKRSMARACQVQHSHRTTSGADFWWLSQVEWQADRNLNGSNMMEVETINFWEFTQEKRGWTSNPWGLSIMNGCWTVNLGIQQKRP